MDNRGSTPAFNFLQETVDPAKANKCLFGQQFNPALQPKDDKENWIAADGYLLDTDTDCYYELEADGRELKPGSYNDKRLILDDPTESPPQPSHFSPQDNHTAAAPNRQMEERERTPVTPNQSSPRLPLGEGSRRRRYSAEAHPLAGQAHDYKEEGAFPDRSSPYQHRTAGEKAVHESHENIFSPRIRYEGQQPGPIQPPANSGSTQPLTLNIKQVLEGKGAVAQPTTQSPLLSTNPTSPMITNTFLPSKPASQTPAPLPPTSSKPALKHINAAGLAQSEANAAHSQLMKTAAEMAGEMTSKLLFAQRQRQFRERNKSKTGVPGQSESTVVNVTFNGSTPAQPSAVPNSVNKPPPSPVERRTGETVTRPQVITVSPNMSTNKSTSVLKVPPSPTTPIVPPPSSHTTGSQTTARRRLPAVNPIMANRGRGMSRAALTRAHQAAARRQATQQNHNQTRQPTPRQRTSRNSSPPYVHPHQQPKHRPETQHYIPPRTHYQHPASNGHTGHGGRS